jgi:hypothetical protein
VLLASGSSLSRRHAAEGVAAQEGSMPSAMYPFEKLAIRTPNNAQIRDVLKGKLATGESLEVHETTLPPGGAPTRHTAMCTPKCG